MWVQVPPFPPFRKTVLEKGRFLYKYAGSFLEASATLCLNYRFPEGIKTKVENTIGQRPKTFEIDFLKANNKDEVLAWIRSAGDKTLLARRGRGVFSGDTLYYGKHSRRWSLKMYSKGHELIKHKLPSDLDIPQLKDFADKALRIELTLRSLELKHRGIEYARTWTPQFARMLLIEAIGKLEMSNNFSLSDDTLALLKPRLRLAYKAWLHGDDLRQDLPKMTYYRYRKELLEFGIDISNVQDVDKPLDNVVPLVRVLEALPASIPDWAYEKKLVVC